MLIFLKRVPEDSNAKSTWLDLRVTGQNEEADPGPTCLPPRQYKSELR